LGAQVGQKGTKREPTGAQKSQVEPKVSQRVTKIFKKSIFGKGREKKATIVCESYEIWIAFGTIFYQQIN
jgi:hypothetical protein